MGFGGHRLSWFQISSIIRAQITPVAILTLRRVKMGLQKSSPTWVVLGMSRDRVQIRTFTMTVGVGLSATAYPTVQIHQEAFPLTTISVLGVVRSIRYAPHLPTFLKSV